jgi:hypothetical protein
MDKKPPGQGPSRKPSGPITYVENVGANTFPGTFLNDSGFVRVRDGSALIFGRDIDKDHVEVIIRGETVVLPRTEWRSLAVYRP